MGSMARGRDQHLLQECVNMREHQSTERGQLVHSSLKRCAREAHCGAWKLHEKSRGRNFSAKHGLEAVGTFAAKANIAASMAQRRSAGARFGGNSILACGSLGGANMTLRIRGNEPALLNDRGLSAAQWQGPISRGLRRQPDMRRERLSLHWHGPPQMLYAGAARCS